MAIEGVRQLRARLGGLMSARRSLDVVLMAGQLFMRAMTDHAATIDEEIAGLKASIAEAERKGADGGRREDD